LITGIILKTYSYMAIQPRSNRVAQRKRSGPITQRYKGRNLALLPSKGNPESPRSTSGSITGGQPRVEKASSMSVGIVDKGGELARVSTKEMSRKQVSPSLLDNTAILSNKVMKDGPEPCLDVSRQATKTQIGTVGISAPNPTVVGGGGGKVTIPSTPERSQSVSRGGHHAECDSILQAWGHCLISITLRKRRTEIDTSPPIGNANCAQGNINVSDTLQAHNLRTGRIRSGDYVVSPPYSDKRTLVMCSTLVRCPCLSMFLHKFIT
jgi:hypothetical protein